MLLVLALTLTTACGAAQSQPSDAAPFDPGVSEGQPTSPQSQSADFAGLLEVQQRMIADRAALQAGSMTAEGLESAGAARGCYALDVTDRPPRLTVFLPRITDEAKDWFGRYGEELSFVTGVATPDLGPDHPGYDKDPAQCRQVG